MKPQPPVTRILFKKSLLDSPDEIPPPNCEFPEMFPLLCPALRVPIPEGDSVWIALFH
jgi:hypothetical protein